MRGIRIALLAALLGAASRAPGTGVPVPVSGRVFLDANANGALDAGEPGIAGVRLTDGVSFAASAADGAYAIDVMPYTIRIGTNEFPTHAQAQTVSICWPSGLWPTGRWWARMSDIADPKSVNFGLRKDAQQLPFFYLHDSDCHGNFVQGYAEFARFAGSLGSDLKFIFNTGDTSFGVVEAEKACKVPFFHTIGNHDIHGDPSPDLFGYGAWTKFVEPVRWSFDYAGIRFAGFDVIEGEACGADWIRKDLESVPKGGRVILFWHYPNPDTPPEFLKMLQDYRVEMAHAGHNHTYVNWDWVIPLYTAFNYRAPGNANLGVVHSNGTDVAFTCIGCKGDPYRHSRRCPVEWLDHILLANIQKLFADVHTSGATAVTGELAPVAVRETRALVAARLAPGAARRAGLRIGSGEKTVELAITADRITVAGVPMPLKSRQADGTLNLTVFVQKNLLTIWAEDYFFWEKAVALDAAAQVVVFAEGGQASLQSLSVQEVKPDPPGLVGGYCCNCAHGGLRRTE